MIQERKYAHFCSHASSFKERQHANLQFLLREEEGDVRIADWWLMDVVWITKRWCMAVTPLSHLITVPCVFTTSLLRCAGMD